MDNPALHMVLCRKKYPVTSLGCTILRYPVPMATTHQLLDRWDDEKQRERRGGVSLLLHPLGQSVTQAAIASRFTQSLPKTSTPPHYTHSVSEWCKWWCWSSSPTYISRVLNNTVSLAKFLTMSNERGSSCVVDMGLKINGPGLFYDITSVSALKQHDNQKRSTRQDNQHKLAEMGYQLLLSSYEWYATGSTHNRHSSCNTYNKHTNRTTIMSN